MNKYSTCPYCGKETELGMYKILDWACVECFADVVKLGLRMRGEERERLKNSLRLRCNARVSNHVVFLQHGNQELLPDVINEFLVELDQLLEEAVDV